jgi:hypothetical protein
MARPSNDDVTAVRSIRFISATSSTADHGTAALCRVRD